MDEIIEELKGQQDNADGQIEEVFRKILSRQFGEGKIVVIGSSTGGPAALEFLLPQFPGDFPFPILVVQHLPKKFTKSFSERLNKICNLRVKEAEDREKVKPGTIYIAPGGINMEVSKDNNGEIELLLKEDDKCFFTPSVDKLMNSAVKIYKDKVVGVILTGMGNDGLLGMRAIKEAGGKTLVQDKATSVVYGMPKEVEEKGFADEIVPLNKIPRKIIEAIYG